MDGWITGFLIGLALGIFAANYAVQFFIAVIHYGSTP